MNRASVTPPKTQFARFPGNPTATPACPPRQQAEIPRVKTADAKSKCLISNPRASLFGVATSKRHFSTLADLRGLSASGVRLAYGRWLPHS